LALPHLWQRIHDIRPRLHFPRRRPPKSNEPIHVEAPAVEIVQSFRTYSKWASIITMVVGYHIFLGWIFNIGILKSPWPSFSSTSISAAICAMLAGIALYFIQTTRNELQIAKHKVVPISAAIIAGICLFMLTARFFGLDWSMGHWTFSNLHINESPTETGNGPPGWMAPITAASFLMVALALLFQDRPATSRWAEGLSLAAAAMSLLALAAFFYEARTFHGQLPIY
jgi:two-component system, cell cycle sensor histidine kinase and response regulator CckA